MRSRNPLEGLLSIFLTSLVAACGGGGSGSGGSGAAPAAPTLTLAATSLAVGSSTTLTWSSADATSCTASGSWSGTLAASGTKTLTPSAPGTFTYTLTCANSAGSSKASTATLTATALAYGSPNYQYTVGIAAQTLTPSNASSIKSWSISPALPAGLTFDTTTGAISGTPTATSPSATYAITGISSGGQQLTLNLAIGVTANILLNLGDVDSLQFIQFDGAHVVTQDSSGHWFLWNYATTAQIASGVSLVSYIPPHTTDTVETIPAPVALAGPTAVIQTASGLEVRSAATGQVLAEIAVHLQWWKLAIDGSFVCAGNGTGLACWSPSGQQLFSEAGNYFNAAAIAVPGALLIALGAAGNSVIETVSSATWTSSVGAAFQGAFSSWFVDGSHFLTTIPAGTQLGTTIAAFNTLFVYSLTSVLEDTETMPTLQDLTGQGNWFWTAASALSIYAIGNNTVSCIPIPCTMPTPTATYTLFSPQATIGTFIAQISGNALTVIDLSGATPVETGYTVPVANPSAYGAIAPSQFMVGTAQGVIIDGSTPNAPRYFGHGQLTAFAGSSNRVAFTTARGETFSYNLTTNVFETTIQLPPDVRELALSADGGVLAALAGFGDVSVYSMPSGTAINSFTNAGTVSYIGLSSTGTVLGELACSACFGQTIPVAGGASSVYPDVLSIPQLSPDGTLVAVSDTPPPFGDGYGAPVPPTTRIYNNGALVTTVPGWVLGWPTNSSFIVARFSLSGPLYTDGRLSSFTFTGDEIYSASGVALGASAIGPTYTLQFFSGGLAFDNSNNTIISTSTGATTWASADPLIVLSAANPVGALPADAFSGSAVVFASENQIVAQPY